MLSQFKRIMLVTGFGLVLLLSSCGPAPTATVVPTSAPPTTVATKPAAPTVPAPTVVPVAKYKESQQLADLVKAGKLPPVEQRLPKNPVVVPVVEKIGKYGGTWRIGLVGGGEQSGLLRFVDYENLTRWDSTASKILPNVAESYQANADSSEFVFKLREGMRWSDGNPFTADDILFWFDDVVMNKDLTAAPPAWLQVNNKVAQVEKVDTYTIKFKFVGPYGLFPTNLAYPDAGQMLAVPKHYMQKFQKKYNPDVDKLAKDAGLNIWVDLWKQKGGDGIYGVGRYANVELPHLSAWIPLTPYDGKATQVTFGVNPYYWKVDPEGNQLPYIEKIQATIAGDPQALTLKAINGEIDFQDRHIATTANKAVFAENLQKANIHFYDMVPSQQSTFVIGLNLTHKNPVLRQIFQNKDFRIGLSYAINRKEINDTIYVGQGKPYQAAPRPESPFYDEKMATQYTDYSVDKANQSLDKAGYTRKDADGFRLGPDGKRISFTIESVPIYPDWNDSLQLIQGYWKKVGIDMQFKVEDRTLLFQRQQANDHDAAVWGGAGGLDVIVDPRWYFPTDPVYSPWGVNWAYWYLGDTRGEEPPATVKKQIELFNQIKATADGAKQADMMKQILAIASNEFYVLGVVLTPSAYGIQKNTFHNVPKSFASSFTWASPAQVNPCQFYVD